ncbi:MAG: hypothetical protein EXS05_07060 [Planctomycetaceae bacterium]|nr:hypothetical protein [Planctomycetaceae bacterium]
MVEIFFKPARLVGQGPPHPSVPSVSSVVEFVFVGASLPTARASGQLLIRIPAEALDYELACQTESLFPEMTDFVEGVSRRNYEPLGQK